MSYDIKLPFFEGPFDLLLFFIERDELDIHDIPISEITEEFLLYIRQMEELNIEVASEFILVAATLMRIKSRMLLPRPEIDEEGNEVDPRDELVKHLLEYKRYKSIIKELAEMETEFVDREKRGNIQKEVKKLAESTNVESELLNVDLYKLLKVYKRVLDRYKEDQNRPRHEVYQYPYTMDGQKEYILNSVKNNSRISFTDIIKHEPVKMCVIFNFLSILELLQQRQITVHVGEGFNNFWIQRVKEGEEQNVTE